MSPIRITLLCLATLTIWSCSTKSETTEVTTEAADEWKGMDEFHMIMAESFHPFRDSSNVEPAKQYAREMVQLAEKWSANELPSKVDNEKVKQLLEELKNESVALADLVEIGDESAIGTSLTKVHDVFHQLQEAWYSKGENE